MAALDIQGHVTASAVKVDAEPHQRTNTYIYINTWVCKIFRCIFGL